MDNKKNKTLAVVLGIFALVIVTTTASFAFFTYSRTGTNTSTIISGDIEFSFIEGTSATLANAFPVADSVGALDTTGEYSFNVKLASSSNSNKMNYNVLLVDNNDDTGVNYFNNEQIKFSLVKNNTYVANTSSTSGVKLSDIDGFDELSNQGEGIVLQDQEITAGTTDNYKLRIWISDDVNYSNTVGGQDNQESIGKYNSYKYSLKVKVTSGLTDNIHDGSIKNLKVNNKTVTADLSDPNGLSAYAVTQSQVAPADSSNEWIEITNDISKSNAIRTSDSLITEKSISYTVIENGTYYLHVKNKLKKIISKSFSIEVLSYNDASGANEPIIKTGMIPVMYDGTNWIKADTTEEWYNYDEQWWANAVTVSESNRENYINAEAGTPISMDDINTMWVWVPRYEYETITSTTETEIKVNFLSGTASNKTSNYITHPAFTFGTDELTGIWIAKFEASSDQECTVQNWSVDSGCDLTTLKVNVKPNVTAWRGIRVSTLDLNTRVMNADGNIYGFSESEVDTHVMKNTEWGAVAYLSQSKYGKYGNPNFTGIYKEIYQNNVANYITGMAKGSPNQSNGTLAEYDVEVTGTGASTTGTIYGVYDMSGGAAEYVMGVMKDNKDGNPMSGRNVDDNSGFLGVVYNNGFYNSIEGREWPALKYYDLYDYATSSNISNATNRYKNGDATMETRNWYSDVGSYYVHPEAPWFQRGGSGGAASNYNERIGIFSFGVAYGYGYDYMSFRPTLIIK